MLRIAALLALLFWSIPSAYAHDIAAQRAVIVQAEPGSAAILITWLAGNDSQADFVTARALWSKRDKSARRALDTEIAQLALDNLDLVLDHKPLRIGEVKTKITLDPNGSGRLGVAILIDIRLEPGSHTLEASSSHPSRTKIRWLDHTDGRAHASLDATKWYPLSRPLALTWTVP